MEEEEGAGEASSVLMRDVAVVEEQLTDGRAQLVGEVGGVERVEIVARARGDAHLFRVSEGDGEGWGSRSTQG